MIRFDSVTKSRGLLRAERSNPFSVRAVGEHIKFNKTTETQGLQRKAVPFYEKKRWEFSQKEENDSQIIIHRAHVVLILANELTKIQQYSILACRLAKMSVYLLR